MTYLNQKIFCYLTDEADNTIKAMVKAGFDPDLALSVLEQLWPEAEIYEVPARDQDMSHGRD